MESCCYDNVYENNGQRDSRLDSGCRQLWFLVVDVEIMLFHDGKDDKQPVFVPIFRWFQGRCCSLLMFI